MSAAPDNASPAVQIAFHGIGKRFFGNAVLNNISLHVLTGQTLGLIGENGAGKSTLMNILGGNLKPDSGSMNLRGRPYAPESPRDATAHGIGFVHQELNLFTNLSIAENIFIDQAPVLLPALPWLNRRQMHERTRELLDQLELSHAPETLVEDLTPGERQLVEIARALSRNVQLLILDEPTTSLAHRETARLFEILRRLRREDISLIYISHNLAEVLSLADQVTVLRDGEVVETVAADETHVDALVSRMVGRKIEQFFPLREVRPSRETVLAASGITQPGILKEIAFELRRGEILGISGLMGSGRTELARVLFGLDPCREGDLKFDGHSIWDWSPRKRIRHGMAFLTEDRRAEGLCMDASIFDNISLGALERFVIRAAGWIRFGDLREATRQIWSSVRLTSTARDEQPVKTLSGGNQQKTVLAKWLMCRPRVILLDEPTRGIDVGAKHEIYQLMNQLTAQGAGIVMISSEMEELIGMCDRILVMNRGEIRDVIEPQDYDRERILKAALHEAS